MNESATMWVRIAAVGAATGMRSMMSLATESRAAAAGRLYVDKGLLSSLAHRAVARCLALMAFGEVLVDKSEKLPSRTDFGPFEGRLAFGALAGVVLARAQGRPPAWGAAVGATSAGISAILMRRIRLLLDRAGLHDPVVAIGEDLVAFSLSRWAIMDHEIPRR